MASLSKVCSTGICRSFLFSLLIHAFAYSLFIGLCLVIVYSKWSRAFLDLRSSECTCALVFFQESLNAASFFLQFRLATSLFPKNPRQTHSTARNLSAGPSNTLILLGFSLVGGCLEIDLWKVYLRLSHFLLNVFQEVRVGPIKSKLPHMASTCCCDLLSQLN